MRNRTPITLLAVSLLLLLSACSPQLVRDEKPPTATDDINEAGKTDSRGQTIASTDTMAQRAEPPSTSKSELDVSKKRSETPAYKPKPKVFATKATPKTKPKAKATTKPITKPKPKAATKPIAEPKSIIAAKPTTEPDAPSIASTTTNPVEIPVSEEKTDSEITLEVVNDPLQDNIASEDTREENEDTVAVPSITEPTIEPPAERMAVESHRQVTQDAESMDDTQQLAMLTPAITSPEEPRPEVPATENVTVDMASLPLSFGVHWSLDRRPNPVNRKTQCVLASQSVNISDGYDRTNVQLLLTADSLYANTESNIDLSYPGSGVRLDDGTLVPFEGLAKETVAMIKGDVAALYERMAPTRIATVRLGFWPTWPVTETQEASFPLHGIGDAIKALWLCEKM